MPPQLRLRGPLLACGVVVLALLVLALDMIVRHERNEQQARVTAVAQARAQQVQLWLQHTGNLAALLRSDTALSALWQRWQVQADEEAGRTLAARLIAFRKAASCQAVMLVALDGRLVWTEPGWPHDRGPGAALMQRASASGLLEIGDMHPAVPGVTPAHLDVAMPIGDAQGRVHAVAVMLVDPQLALGPRLTQWPVRSDTAELVLWQRSGDELVAVLPLRQRPDAAGLLRYPVATSQTPSARVLREEVPAGRAFDAVDANGEQVLAAVELVAHSPLVLVAKINRSEWLQPVWGQAAAAVALAVMALAACYGWLRLRSQRSLLAGLEAQRSEQAAQLRSLSLLRAVAEGCGDAIYVSDAEGRLVMANQAACRDLGWSPAELLTRSLRDIDPGFDDAAAAPAGPAAAQVRLARHQRKDGSSFPVELQLTQVEVDGRLLTLAFARNLSDREAAAAALQVSQHRLALTLNASGIGLWELDVQRNVYHLSPEAWRMVGLPVPALGFDADVSAPAVMDSIVEDDRERVRAQLQQVLESGMPLQIEFRAHHTDGRVRWLLDDGRLVRDASGRPTRLLGTVQDISARKAAEYELEQHRHHLQQLVDERTRELDAGRQLLQMVTDALPNPVAYWSNDEICLFANRHYLLLLGRTADEVLGKSLDELLPPERQAHIRPFIDRARGGEAVVTEMQRAHPVSGEILSTLSHFIPNWRDGELHGLLFVANDITALKRAEDELRTANDELLLARDRADTANRAKSAFLANMSHEIRTPLNAISGMAYLLQRDLRDEQARQRVSKIAEAAQHLLALINDILDLSKIESGKLELEELDFSLGSVLTRAAALVADAARRKGLALVIDAGTAPDALRGDPTRLMQTLVNLLSNAVKFTTRGSVQVHVEQLPAPGSPGVHLRFSVQDTGIGIAADKIDGLFQAFAQADSSTTRRFGGTGLGLAIARRLVEMMGGTISVRSAVDQGSTFSFDVQLARAAAAEPARDAPPPIASGSAFEQLRARVGTARILLAEDNPINQEVTLDLLRSAGLQVTVAGNGLEALALAAREHFDLVLMDVQMPEMDGLEATRRLRSQPHSARWPVIAMTANAFAEDRAACLDAGMNDYLTKPTEAHLLYALLLRWLPPAGPTKPAVMPDAAKAPAPAPPPVNPMPRLPGFEVETGQRRIGGRPQMYWRVLLRFADEYRQGLPGLDQALAQGDRAALSRLAHSIKGAAGAVAATSLQAQAEQLESLALGSASADELATAAHELQHTLETLTTTIAAAGLQASASA